MCMLTVHCKYISSLLQKKKFPIVPLPSLPNPPLLVLPLPSVCVTVAALSRQDQKNSNKLHIRFGITHILPSFPGASTAPPLPVPLPLPFSSANQAPTAAPVPCASNAYYLILVVPFSFLYSFSFHFPPLLFPSILCFTSLVPGIISLSYRPCASFLSLLPFHPPPGENCSLFVCVSAVQCSALFAIFHPPPLPSLIPPSYSWSLSFQLFHFVSRSPLMIDYTAADELLVLCNTVARHWSLPDCKDACVGWGPKCSFNPF